MGIGATYGYFLILSDGLFILVFVHRGLEDLDTVMANIRKDLMENKNGVRACCSKHLHTRCLNSVISSSVKVSALAITGIRLTF